MPLALLEPVRMFVLLAAKHDMTLHQVETRIAFLLAQIRLDNPQVYIILAAGVSSALQNRLSTL